MTHTPEGGEATQAQRCERSGVPQARRRLCTTGAPPSTGCQRLDEQDPQTLTPSKASRSFSTSIFVIWSIASVARFAASRSGLAMYTTSCRGTTCHDRPKRSFSQPQTLGSPPPAMRASQYLSTSAWFSQSIENETASLNLKSGPPLSPMNGCPATVKSTVRTMPAGPLGVSAGDRLILSIRLFGKSDV